MQLVRSSLLLTAIATAIGAAAAQQQLLLPPTHHLSESAQQTSGTTSAFRTTAGRMQILYDAPSFLQSGVSGPITIQKLRFRGEDTEPNHGGQTYANVTVQVGSTSLSAGATTWTSIWADNWAPALPNTTTPGPVVTIPALVVAPSLGTAPNNYCIEIDLAALGGSIVFDPTSAEPNLLIEIIMPTAPVATIGNNLNLIQIQDTTGASAAAIGGSCRVSSNPTGTTSATAINPPVVNVEFAGAGGYATLIPSRVASYGAACGGQPSAFYQLWRHNESFDLANSSMTLTPDNPVSPSFWTVTPGGGAFDPTQVNATPTSTGDDIIVTHALGYTFNYPGGSTTDLRPSCNGHIWLDAGTMGTADFSPTLAKFLGNGATETARLAPCWYDFNCGRNVNTHPNSGLHVLNDTSGGPGNTVTYVTWLNVSRANVSTATTTGPTAQAHAVYNVQCVLYEATGAVEFRYGSMSEIAGSTGGTLVAAITGFTRGNIGGVPSVDPQSRDLSHELPFTTTIEGATSNVGLVPVQAATAPTNQPGRLFAGQSITWNATNVPAGTILGGLFVDFAALTPGLQIPTITAPGCIISLTPNALAWELFVTPGSTATGTVPLSLAAGYSPGLLGIEVFAQFLVLDGLFAGPDLITSSSQALKHTIGLQ